MNRQLLTVLFLGAGLALSQDCSAAESKETTRLRLCAVRKVSSELFKKHPNVFRDGSEIYLGLDLGLHLDLMVNADRQGLVKLPALDNKECRNNLRLCSKKMSSQFLSAIREPRFDNLCNIASDSYLAEIDRSISDALDNKKRPEEWKSAAWIYFYLSAATPEDLPLPSQCDLHSHTYQEVVIDGPTADYQGWLKACFSNWNYRLYFNSKKKQSSAESERGR